MEPKKLLPILLLVLIIFTGCNSSNDNYELHTRIEELETSNNKLIEEKEELLNKIDVLDNELSQKIVVENDTESEIAFLNETIDSLEGQLKKEQEELESLELQYELELQNKMDNTDSEGNDYTIEIKLDSDEDYDKYNLPSKDSFHELVKKSMFLYLENVVLAPSYDYDIVFETENDTYYKITDENYLTFEKRKDYLHQYFSDELVNYFIQFKRIKEFDGEMYTVQGEDGLFYHPNDNWYMALINYDDLSQTADFELYFRNLEYLEIHYDLMKVSVSKFGDTWKISDLDYLF